MSHGNCHKKKTPTISVPNCNHLNRYIIFMGKICVLPFNQAIDKFESDTRRRKKKTTTATTRHLQKHTHIDDSKSFCITPIWQRKLLVKTIIDKLWFTWLWLASVVPFLHRLRMVRLHVVSATVIYEMEAIKQNLYLKSHEDIRIHVTMDIIISLWLFFSLDHSLFFSLFLSSHKKLNKRLDKCFVSVGLF